MANDQVAKRSNVLEVLPPYIEFDQFEVGNMYITSFSVRNRSKRNVRYRVIPPSHASPFRILYQSKDLARTNNSTILISAGLSVKYEVTFTITEDNTSTTSDATYHDMIQLKLEDQSIIDIALIAKKACPNIELDSIVCEVGPVVLHQRVAKYITLENTGTRDGEFDTEILEPCAIDSELVESSQKVGRSTNNNDGNAISVSPEQGVILKQDRLQLKIMVQGKIVGQLLGIIRIRVRNHMPKLPEQSVHYTEKMVNVSAEIVEHNVELLMKVGSEKLQMLYFGSIFAGEQKKIEGRLINNGPRPIDFKAVIKAGGNKGLANVASVGILNNVDEDREVYDSQKEFSISPQEGYVSPYSEVNISFVYHPKSVDSDYILQLQKSMRLESGTSARPVQISAFASIDWTDNQSQNLTLEISANKFFPVMEISPSVIDFGDVKTNERADFIIVVKNISGLPASFTIAKIAQFSANPSVGRLDVLQSQSIIVSFKPSQLGQYSSTLNVYISNTGCQVPISVHGCAYALGEKKQAIAGGPFALPEDFQPKYKFILADEVQKSKDYKSKKFQRIAPYDLAALNGTAAVDEYEFQGTNNTHLTYCVKELAERDKHRKKYNQFLVDSRSNRRLKRRSHVYNQSGSDSTSTNQSVLPERDVNGDDITRISQHYTPDIGMDPRGSCNPRMLQLPKEISIKNEPLWLSQASQSEGSTSTGGSRVPFDENKLIKKKYKTQPSTQAEISDCSTPLVLEALEQVLSGPKSINYGKVFVNATSKKGLSVINNLSQNILVALQLSPQDNLEEISVKTTLISQVIPPFCTAGFDLIFASKIEQFFQKSLTYVINGTHTRQVTISAEVIPIAIELSTHELKFEFDSRDTNPSMIMTFSMANTGDSHAVFQWDMLKPNALSDLATSSSSQRPDSSKSTSTAAVGSEKIPPSIKPIFTIKPSSGTLRPGEVLTCEVCFTMPSPVNKHKANEMYQVIPFGPGGSLWLSNNFELSIKGGRKCLIACKALVYNMKISVKEKKIDFGMVSIGTETSKVIEIVNITNASCTQQLVYYATVEPPTFLQSLGVVIKNPFGQIPLGGTVDLSISILPLKPVQLENVNLCIQVRGGKSQKIPLVGTVVVPNIKILQDVIDYGKVIIGVSVPRLITVENEGSIPAFLNLDLSIKPFNDFSLSIPIPGLEVQDDISDYFTPMTESSEVDNESCVSGKDVSGYTQNSPIVNNSRIAHLSNIRNYEDQKYLAWKICIPANSVVSFELVYAPKEAGELDCALPLQFACKKPLGSMAQPDSIFRRISGHAALPRVLFSNSILNFHKCVITREGIRKVPFTKTLILTNTDSTSVNWHINTSCLNISHMENQKSKNTSTTASTLIFHIAPDKGELAPQEEVKIRVSFHPIEPIEYIEKNIPLSLDNEFYVSLELRGIGIRPHLSFSERRLLLPTVPLGYPSKSKFSIQSTGYDHLEISHRIPLDLSRVPLTLTFPKGNIVSMACPTIPVEACFQSDKSIAFNARVEFFDTDGNTFYFTIAGCTENCILTNYDFVYNNLAIEKEIDLEDCCSDQKPLVPVGMNCLQFYTHSSMKYPIYLLPIEQVKAEIAKQSDTINVSDTVVENNKGQEIAPRDLNTIKCKSDKVASGFDSNTPISKKTSPSKNASIESRKITRKTSDKVNNTLNKDQDALVQRNNIHNRSSSNLHKCRSGFISVDTSYFHSNLTCAPTTPRAGQLQHNPYESGPHILLFKPQEVKTLLQYLNSNFLRVPIVTFPNDLSDAMGKPLEEILDSICAKKPPTLPVNNLPRGKQTGALGSNASQWSKRDQQAHCISYFTELLKFLKGYGAMLHDVLPEHLLNQEFYIKSLDNSAFDLPFMSSSPSTNVIHRRHILEKEWKIASSNAWMKVLYQVVKCFVLYRITVKTYRMEHDSTLSSPPKITLQEFRACKGSNVYSESEMVLIQWICDQVRPFSPNSDSKSENIFPEANLLDIRKDLQNGKLLFHLLAAHIPTLTTETIENECFRLNTSEYDSNRRLGQLSRDSSKKIQPTELLHDIFVKFSVDIGLDRNTFLYKMNGREILVYLLHLYQVLPQFIPKATIEFKGVLGQVMEKKIELNNPSPGAIHYQVFLDGLDSSKIVKQKGVDDKPGIAEFNVNEFTVESDTILLEPGKTASLRITFTPRFARKMKCRLVLQSLKNDGSCTPNYGATMVFILESSILSRKPVRCITTECNTYEKQNLEITLENPFPVNGDYKVYVAQWHHQEINNMVSQIHGTQRNKRTSLLTSTSASNDDTSNSTLSAQRKLTQKVKSDDLDFVWCINRQKAFYLPDFGFGNATTHDAGKSSTSLSSGDEIKDIDRPAVGMLSISSNGSATIQVEFLPLTPGKYTCQLLLIDEAVGEFMYEINAVAQVPSQIESLTFQCELPNQTGATRARIHKELILPIKNPQLAKALGSYIDRFNGALKTRVKEGFRRCETMHHTNFSVEFNSPFFSSVFPDVNMRAAVEGQKQGISSITERTITTNRTELVQQSGREAQATGNENSPMVLPSKTNTSISIANSKQSHAKICTPRTSSAVASTNAVLIDFQPKNSGVYTTKVIIRSQSTNCGSTDIRIYEIVAKVREPNVKTMLEFVAPARQTIVQEIPLSNPSDTLWTLQATFHPPNGQFSGPATIQVQPKQRVNYPLSFTPKWISQRSEHSFTLINTATLQQFEFALIGFGEEPLAHDHVVLNCQARSSIVHEFDVFSFKDDPAGEQSFSVESDFREVIGDSVVTIPHAGGKKKYTLTFSPIIGGTYFGSITFTNLATKEYIWYTIEGNVTPPDAESTLDMRAVVRMAVGVEISLANPLDHPITFEIELRGRGVVGPTTFKLDALATSSYELIYSPLHVTTDENMQSRDGAILFSNDEIGQFWYKLNLIAEKGEAHVLDDMFCAVGDVCTQPIILVNPSNESLNLQYTISNPGNYSIKGVKPDKKAISSIASSKTSSSRTISLAPYGQATAILEYTPSSLSEFETTSIVFFSPGIVSDWEFIAKGKGLPPSIMKPIVVMAKVREAATTVLAFRNPFASPLHIEMKLVVGENAVTSSDFGDKQAVRRDRWSLHMGEANLGFEILLKKQNVILDKFGLLQVPILFSPKYVCEMHAEIIVTGLDNFSELEWRYPVRGLGEAPLHPKAFVFASQARQMYEKQIFCELLAAPPNMQLDREVFSIEWEIPANRFGQLCTSSTIEKTLKVSPIENTEACLSQKNVEFDTNRIYLPYTVQFEPLRPYRGSLYLLIKKHSGGIWRFEVILDVSDPPIDDTLVIESSLNQTSSISFQMRNEFREHATFIAEFSAGSSRAFTVYPSQGVLPPYGSEDGITFIVSFTPIGYGIMQSGQLIILTEEMQWTFNVKGTYPNVSYTNTKSSTVDARARLYGKGTKKLTI